MNTILKKLSLMTAVVAMSACGDGAVGNKGAKFTTPSPQAINTPDTPLRQIYFYSPDDFYTGGLGGSNGANGTCKAELPIELENFEAHAMLNYNSLQTIESMAEMQGIPNVPIYAFGSNMRLAANWDDLLANGLEASLADAGIFPANTIYWTGFNANGATAQNFCNGFNNGTGSYSGQIGNSDYSDARWAGYQEDACSTFYRLLCVAFTQ